MTPFAHKPRLLDVAAVIPVAGQRTHGTTFIAPKITSQVATSGAEYAVYDCLLGHVVAKLGRLVLG